MTARNDIDKRVAALCAEGLSVREAFDVVGIPWTRAGTPHWGDLADEIERSTSRELAGPKNKL